MPIPIGLPHEVEHVHWPARRGNRARLGKEGHRNHEILEAIVEAMPPPSGDRRGPTRALIFDSHYDPYKGVIAYVKVVDGTDRTNDRIRLINSGNSDRRS